MMFFSWCADSQYFPPNLFAVRDFIFLISHHVFYYGKLVSMLEDVSIQLSVLKLFGLQLSYTTI